MINNLHRITYNNKHLYLCVEAGFSQIRSHIFKEHCYGVIYPYHCYTLLIKCIANDQFRRSFYDLNINYQLWFLIRYLFYFAAIFVLFFLYVLLHNVIYKTLSSTLLNSPLGLIYQLIMNNSFINCVSNHG